MNNDIKVHIANILCIGYDQYDQSKKMSFLGQTEILKYKCFNKTSVDTCIFHNDAHTAPLSLCLRY